MHDYFMIRQCPCMYIAIGTMLLYTYLYTQRSEEAKRKQSEQRRLYRGTEAR